MSRSRSRSRSKLSGVEQAARWAPRRPRAPAGADPLRARPFPIRPHRRRAVGRRRRRRARSVSTRPAPAAAAGNCQRNSGALRTRHTRLISARLAVVVRVARCPAALQPAPPDGRVVQVGQVLVGALRARGTAQQVDTLRLHALSSPPQPRKPSMKPAVPLQELAAHQTHATARSRVTAASSVFCARHCTGSTHALHHAVRIDFRQIAHRRVGHQVVEPARAQLRTAWAREARAGSAGRCRATAATGNRPRPARRSARGRARRHRGAR